MFQKWQRSSVNSDQGSGLHFMLNYNIIQGYAVVNIGSVERIVYPASFVVNDRTFIRLKNQYCEVLHSGKRVKLLRWYSVRLKKSERNSNTDVKYDYEYTKSESLFLREANGSIVPFKLQERNFLSKLPDPKAARQIVENNNLNLRTEQDVLTLLTKLEG